MRRGGMYGLGGACGWGPGKVAMGGWTCALKAPCEGDPGPVGVEMATGSAWSRGGVRGGLIRVQVRVGAEDGKHHGGGRNPAEELPVVYALPNGATPAPTRTPPV